MTTETQAKNTEDKVDFEIEGDDFEIEIQDDTPPEDRGKSRRTEEASDDSEDDLESYSESVKKRINKLRYEYHEERRNKEEALRIKEEAIRFAGKAHKEAENLRKQLTQGQTVVVDQAKARVETQLEQAKASFKQAYEAGDADAMLEAQTKLTQLSNELYRLSSYRPPQQPTQAQPQQGEQGRSQNFQPRSKTQPQKPPKIAMDWLERNPWFQKDMGMTGYAFGVHEELVKANVDPNTEEYYNRIDEAMRKRFPENFEGAETTRMQPRQTGSVVAPSSRSAPKNPRKIVLTTTQVALAKRLGLTPEQYAAQLMKEKTNG